MGMPGDEKFRLFTPDQCKSLFLIPCRRAPDMGHDDLYFFSMKDLVERVDHAKFIPVNVPKYRPERLEPPEFFRRSNIADIACMPDLVAMRKKIVHPGMDESMGVR